MSRKPVVLLTLALLISTSIMIPITSSADTPKASADIDSNIRDLVDKERLHQYAEDIVTISESYPAYRVAGSIGSNLTADYIYAKFTQFGFDTWTEDFEFTNWDLKDVPSLTIDADGNWSTDEDRFNIESFSSESYSWPSNSSRPVAELAYLPMVPADSYEGVLDYYSVPYMFWNDYNIAGKVVVVPREARWNVNIEAALVAKMKSEPPLAVINAYWYNWNSYVPDMSMSSTGGKPLSEIGDYLWDLKVPSGFVNYSDGVLLREMVDSGTGLADLRIDSTIYTGLQENIVAKIEGSEDVEKMMLITAHYDGVMGSAYIDNAAGVAALIETANVMKMAYDQKAWKPDITVMFIAFAGEELGFVGSTRFATTHVISDIVSVINLDSIGSLNMHLSAPREGANIGIDQLFEKVAEEEGVSFSTTDSVSSDHMAFAVPGYTVGLIWERWRVRYSLTTSDLVANSFTVYSSPLLVSESSGEMVGLGHTRLDKVDPEGYSYWNAKERLYSQERVIVGVSLLLLSGEYKNDITDPTWQPFVFGITIVIAALLMFIVFRKKIRD